MKNAKANKRKQIKKSASKTKSKKQSSNVNSDKTVKSVETGIKLLKYAIKNKTSVSEAARENGFGRNYVSDIKARIDNNYKKRSINRELYDSFKSSSKSYEKAQG
jgi:hypothetical protein